MTSSNGNIFRVTCHLCGEFTGLGESPTQRPVMRSFDVFFDLHRNKRLSKQSWGWWFGTLSRPLWRQRNAVKCKKSEPQWTDWIEMMLTQQNLKLNNRWHHCYMSTYDSQLQSADRDLYLLSNILSIKSRPWNLGAVSIRKTVLPSMAIPMLKIRRPNGRLIFNMEIAIRR